jgi:PAS domain-containing protein
LTVFDGKPSDLVIVRDITDRKHAEKTLQESESYLKTIFNFLHTSLAIIDPETHSIIDVNPAAIELIGAARSKIVGSVCHQFIYPAKLESALLQIFIKISIIQSAFS